jgi:hypothetical protein
MISVWISVPPSKGWTRPSLRTHKSPGESSALVSPPVTAGSIGSARAAAFAG